MESIGRGKKDRILRIRCSATTIRRFKRAAADYKDHEETLLAILEAYDEFVKQDPDYVERVKRSIVLRPGHYAVVL